MTLGARGSAARALALLLATGCGSSAPVAVTPPPPPPVDAAAPPLETDEAKRARITAAHHELEDEQATAFAASCSDPPAAHPHKRCFPSCYDGEAPDARAGKPVKPLAEIDHTVCTAASPPDAGPFAITDELVTSNVRASRGHAPAAANKGSWQAQVEAEAASALRPQLARGDVVRVIGTWKRVAHPVTHEALRCVTVVHYAHALRRPLDACGGHGELACEASGNAAAHGIDVVHYRLAEAKRLHAAHDDAGCAQAALEAFAVSRGLPRWRQYAKLNTTTWVAVPRYRTRFDGVLDEDALFAAAAALGSDAEQLYGTCAGASPHTTAAQEQSFHTCW